MASEKEIEAGAAAISWIADEAIDPAEIARDVLEAAEKVREPIVFIIGDQFGGPPLRCTVNGPGDIVVELVK